MHKVSLTNAFINSCIVSPSSTSIHNLPFLSSSLRSLPSLPFLLLLPLFCLQFNIFDNTYSYWNNAHYFQYSLLIQAALPLGHYHCYMNSTTTLKHHLTLAVDYKFRPQTSYMCCKVIQFTPSYLMSLYSDYQSY